MGKGKRKVHEVEEDVMQGVWTQKITNRGVKTIHTAVPGVQGPPSPSKRQSSPIKSVGPIPNSPGDEDDDLFDDIEMIGDDHARSGWGKVSFIL